MLFKTTRVLLVDDQIHVSRVVRAAFADDPHVAVRYCWEAGEVVRVAEDFAPTVVLLDVGMGGASGLSLLRALRDHAQLQAVPVVAMAAEDDRRLRLEAFHGGAVDFVVKLPDEVELRARVRAHSAAYRAHVEREAAYRSLRQLQDELESVTMELQRHARKDPVTGLPSADFFEDYLVTEWRRARRNRAALTVLLVDVDRLDATNRTLGFRAGDGLLRTVGEVIAESLRRPGDRAARLADDTFGVVLPETDASGGEAVAERIQAEIRALVPASGQPDDLLRPAVSIGGAATVPLGDLDPETLLARADEALDEVKASGGAGYAVVRPVGLQLIEGTG